MLMMTSSLSNAASDSCSGPDSSPYAYDGFQIDLASLGYTYDVFLGVPAYP